MIEAGAVSVVLALLRNDPSEKYLIQLLSDLSKVDVGKKAIASERGSMLLLANVFRSTPPNERQLIKTLLDDLCEDDPEMIMDAAKCTIFEPLMSCLNQGKCFLYLLTNITTLKPLTKDARPLLHNFSACRVFRFFSSIEVTITEFYDKTFSSYATEYHKVP